MLPASAKARVYTGKYLRPLNKFRQSKSLQDYYDQRVIKHSGYYDSDCWQFQTAGDKDGYPQVSGSKLCQEAGITRAHQLAYTITNGPIPKGMLVCHTCDNPWCVNPQHLFLGTANDNVQDMMTKGRYLSPVQAGHIRKITPKQKEEILSLKGKIPCTKVGPMYGVSYSNIAYMWRKYASGE